MRAECVFFLSAEPLLRVQTRLILCYFVQFAHVVTHHRQVKLDININISINITIENKIIKLHHQLPLTSDLPLDMQLITLFGSNVNESLCNTKKKYLAHKQTNPTKNSYAYKSLTKRNRRASKIQYEYLYSRCFDIFVIFSRRSEKLKILKIHE